MSQRIALVTGASRGIGAATARLLGKNGYDVCVNYQHQADAANSVVDDVLSSGSRALAIQADVSKPDDVARMFDEIDNELGAINALVNNAGIIGPNCRVDDLDLGVMEQMLQTNVVGLLHCSQQAIRRMSTRHGGKGGAIVNISSGSAYIGNPGGGVHYAMTKGAVNSLTIGLSQEVANEGVRVNAVSPGMTNTDMPSDEALVNSAKTIPMRRIGEPEEIASAVMWLLSDQASYTAGANIRIAGGRP